jgi:hypothetical protein
MVALLFSAGQPAKAYSFRLFYGVGSKSPRFPKGGGSLVVDCSTLRIACSALSSEDLGLRLGPLIEEAKEEILRVAFFI